MTVSELELAIQHALSVGQAAVEGVRTGREPDLLSGKLARDALVLCYRECESVQSGNAVAVA